MRQAQRLEREVRERWPVLRDLFDCYFHQDWVFRSGTVEGVIAEFTETEALERRKLCAQEWWNANAGIAWKSDFDVVLIEGFCVNSDFDNPADARVFWNKIYDALIVGIRKDEKGWKPRN